MLTLDLKQNVGKAEAVRLAMLHSKDANFDYVGYFDADLATPLEEIYNFIEQIELKNPIFILGPRVKLLGLTQIEKNGIDIILGEFSQQWLVKCLKFLYMIPRVMPKC